MVLFMVVLLDFKGLVAALYLNRYTRVAKTLIRKFGANESYFSVGLVLRLRYWRHLLAQY